MTARHRPGVTAVIIIFGAAVRPDGIPSGAMRQRVESALACSRRLGDASFLTTGGQGRYGPPEAEVMQALLLAAGVPGERITVEPTGTNTIRSVRACAALLRGRAAPVYVATSSYHLTRCLVLLRIAGVPARACASPPGPASRSRVKRWWWRLRELPAVPLDSVLLLWLRLSGRM